MKLSDFDYNLPDELIAIEPASPRDHSRLLVLDKKTGKMEHKHFYDIVDYLNPGDILVINNSKVIPARLFGYKASGGKVEVFLHKKISDNIWQCLLGGRASEGLILSFRKERSKEGNRLNYEQFLRDSSLALGMTKEEGILQAKVLKNNNDGTWDIEFNKFGAEFMEIVERIGEVPLPPYIVKQREKELSFRTERSEERNRLNDKQSLRDYSLALGMTNNEDVKNYQTIYAADDKKGSVAAPTAGLHFTPELLEKIKNKGVEILEITLYVGMGTFAPVKTENILEHKMHAEWVEISDKVIEKLSSRAATPPEADKARDPEGLLSEKSVDYKKTIKSDKNVSGSRFCGRDDKGEKDGNDRKGRIIAVGTTSARALEACFSNLTLSLSLARRGESALEEKAGSEIPPLLNKERAGVRLDFKAWVDIFIYPGYEFKIVDALITNFHLPKSTLLMLISALAGKENIDRAYAEAIARKYRFYSYGDAMFIK